MGFPEWTLVGMGLCLLGALIALALALLGQSPNLLKRTGLRGTRLEHNVRTFTGYSFALLLLAIGFFIAGVPIGPRAGDNDETASSPDIGNRLEDTAAADEVSISPTTTLDLSPTAGTPVTGSFSGPPGAGSAEPAVIQTMTGESDPFTSTVVLTTTVPLIEGETTPGASSAESPPGTITRTVMPPTPSPTITPSPTATPRPTLTPTPISGITATVSTGGSTIWLYRSPGGQVLQTVVDEEVVIILTGHANYGGILWVEVSTGRGAVGWLQNEYIRLNE